MSTSKKLNSSVNISMSRLFVIYKNTLKSTKQNCYSNYLLKHKPTFEIVYGTQFYFLMPRVFKTFKIGWRTTVKLFKLH